MAFVEDIGHETFLRPLLESRIPITVRATTSVQFLNSAGGYPSVVREFKKYLDDLARGRLASPDIIVVATDSNCSGYLKRKKTIAAIAGVYADRIVYAIPDPHVERWLLADSKAFKAILGSGCKPPNQKCEKDRYKKLLASAVKAAGGTTLLGGIEYAGDIASQIDLKRIYSKDQALGKFISEYKVKCRAVSYR